MEPVARRDGTETTGISELTVMNAERREGRRVRDRDWNEESLIA